MQTNLNQKPKCANCGEEHTANYRGCSYYKQKVATSQPQKKAVDRLKATASSSNKEASAAPAPAPPSTRPGVNSYANVARKNLSYPEVTNKESTLEQILKSIERLEQKYNSLQEILQKENPVKKKQK